ncbi:MAG: Hsp20/alpha crystallin family protein [Lachnospiraceae bacterium]|jgi:HSP20 family molecular chaperone IbpA|nr:Hsp20/alpha crystallin family protein [Lachnospiraceae bacterium]
MLLPRTNLYKSQLFDNFFNEPLFPDFFSKDILSGFGNTNSLMKTDIKDDGAGYTLEMELPGLDKSDIQAKLENGYLTILASKNEDKDEKDKDGSYVRRERYYGSMKRTFYVGDQVKQEDIKAGFENGILKLTFPKESPKAIEEKETFIPIA